MFSYDGSEYSKHRLSESVFMIDKKDIFNYNLNSNICWDKCPGGAGRSKETRQRYVRCGPERSVMRPSLSFRQYRGMDVAMLSAILALCEGLIVLASTRWFPEQLYTLSVTPAVTAIVMIRWGPWGAVPALAGSFVYCLLSRAAGWQYLVYMAGSLLALALLPVIRRVGWKTIRDRASYAMLYGVCCAVMMQLGRALIALCLGHGQAFLLFFTTDVLTCVFCAVAMWIARRLDGVMEDQKHYLHRVSREMGDGGTEP